MEKSDRLVNVLFLEVIHVKQSWKRFSHDFLILHHAMLTFYSCPGCIANCGADNTQNARVSFSEKCVTIKHLCTCRANESRHLEIIACNQNYCRVEWKFAVLVWGIHVCHTASHISNSKNWEKAHFSSFLHFFEESQFSRAFCEEVKVQNRWMPGSVFNKDGGRWVRVYFLGLVWWIFPWFRFLASWSSMNMRHNTLTKLF